MTPSVIAHVTNAVCPAAQTPGTADDPMPPCYSGADIPYAQRSETDPGQAVRGSSSRPRLAAGSPSSFTYPPPGGDAGAASGDGGAAHQFALAPDVGNAMTNLGSCIPSPALVGVNVQAAQALDAKFEGFSAATTQAPPRR